MKLGLVAGLIGPAIVTAQDEVQYAERDKGGREIKAIKKKENLSTSSGSVLKPPVKSPSPTWWYNSKSSKSAYDDNLFLAPFSCPRKCVEYLQNSTLTVKDCQGNQMNQQWRVSYNDPFMKFQSFYESSLCIGIGKSCANETLTVVPCDNGQLADWYFTGGQYLSGYCWARGSSVAMALQSGCNGALTSGALTSTDSTFMLVGREFIENMPNSCIQEGVKNFICRYTTEPESVARLCGNNTLIGQFVMGGGSLYMGGDTIGCDCTTQGSEAMSVGVPTSSVPSGLTIVGKSTATITGGKISAIYPGNSNSYSLNVGDGSSLIDIWGGNFQGDWSVDVNSGATITVYGRDLVLSGNKLVGTLCDGSNIVVNIKDQFGGNYSPSYGRLHIVVDCNNFPVNGCN